MVIKMVIIDEKNYSALEEIGQIIMLKPKETIFMDEDEANATFLIEYGKVRAFAVSKEGRETTFEVLEKGRIFGEGSFVDKAIRNVSIETLTTTRLVVIENTRLIDLMHKNTELMMCFFQHLIESNNMLIHAMKRLINYDSHQKVADFLLELSHGKNTTLTYSQQDISECLAMNRVTVARVLKDFKDQGLVKTSYGKLSVLNVKKLRALL